MIEVLSSAITAGGPATLIFELTDSHNQRLANMVNGTATMSLRKESTRRTRHELPHLPTTFDPVAGTVSLDLSSAHYGGPGPHCYRIYRQAKSRNSRRRYSPRARKRGLLLWPVPVHGASPGNLPVGQSQTVTNKRR